MNVHYATHSPPPELVRFVQEISKERLSMPHEQRRYPRYKLTVEVQAQPVDASFSPTGPAFTAISRDISATGLGMLHTRAVRDKFLRLQLKTNGGTEIDVVVQVLRCRPLGMFFDIGTHFVRLLDKSST